MEYLPDTALIIIAKNLPTGDLINLCTTNTRFNFLRFYLPDFIDIPGEDLRRWGPSDGHFEPEHYFDSPVMDLRVRSITMTFKWQDQGYGNRKGMVWIDLVRSGEVIHSSLEAFPNLADHKMKSEEIIISNHPVVDGIRKGDILKFMVNVGGGGGHSLKIKDFNAKLEVLKW